MARRHFEERLNEVTGQLMEMSREIEELIETALQALRERDSVKAQSVIMADREIDAAEIEIEDMCIELLATQQPMAIDLRRIVAILKINNDLERIGDHAVNIAYAAQKLNNRESADRTVPIELSEAATIAQGMLRDALDAFVQQDAVKARAVLARDDRVDKLHESLLRSMITFMMENPKDISSSLTLILVSRNVERVADLATNIGEDVVYLVEGKTIRHPDVVTR